jgi:hypothetical protein
LQINILNNNNSKNNNKTRIMNLNAILIIGATGRTGTCLLKRLANVQQPSNNAPTSIFAMCRDASKLSDEARACCDGVIKGNARGPKDMENALKASKADLVIVAVGNGDNVKKNDIRTATAKALVSVVTSMGHRNVRAVIVSSIGSGGSKIKVGFGVGTLIDFHLRHVLHDHDGQAAECLTSSMKERTFIVRPTGLTEGKATGKKVVPFGGNEKCPNLETDREDLANCIAKEVIFNPNGAGRFGKQVCVATDKERRDSHKVLSSRVVNIVY